VVRDTQRNLDLFTFVNEHTDRDDFSWGLQQFRPYVVMMNTRAKASIFLAQGKFADAIAEIERGRESIVDFFATVKLSGVGVQKRGDRVPRRVA